MRTKVNELLDRELTPADAVVILRVLFAVAVVCAAVLVLTI